MDNKFKLKDRYIAVLKEKNIGYNVQANTNDEGEIHSWSIFPNYNSEVSSADELAIVISEDKITIYISNSIKNVDNKEKMLTILNSFNSGFGSSIGAYLSIHSKNFVSLSITTYYDFLDLDNKINLEIIDRAASLAMDAADYYYKNIMKEYYSS